MILIWICQAAYTIHAENWTKVHVKKHPIPPLKGLLSCEGGSGGRNLAVRIAQYFPKKSWLSALP